MMVEFSTLPELIAGRAADRGDDTFLVQAETGEELTYADLDDRANDFAAELLERGLEGGEKVGLVLPNTVDLVEAIAGVQKSGAVAVPVNPEFTTREMSYILEHSASELVIAASSVSDQVKEAAADTAVADVLNADSIEPMSSEIARPEVRPVDTALMMFTSGTTGDPKGVALSHMNLLLRFHGGEMLRGYRTFYTLLPLYNIDGFVSTFGTLYDGGRVLLRDGFSASSFWEDVEAHDAQITSVVPSILAILLERGFPEGTDISSFEVFMASGSYVHEELIADVERVFDVQVMEIYGLTEAAGTGYDNPEDMVPGSAGYPSDFSELCVVDEETREEIPPGEAGEILIRGPTVFKEYFNNPEATNEVFENGWFRTEDIGHVDEDGRYYVLDRMKNIIIRGGQNIYPGEIEETIHSVRGVEDVAVVGEPHDIYGEVPVAYVTSNEDSAVNNVEERVRATCADELVDFKQPEKIHLVESFPRGETGKILKNDL